MKKPLLLFIFLTISIPSFAQTYTVERVIDGNTIVVTMPDGTSEKVRLIGIETPEANTETGQEATEHIKLPILSGNSQVRLEFDVQQRDKYGRLLAYVFIPGRRYHIQHAPYYSEVDGDIYTFLNADMIFFGYAQPITFPPNVKYADLFKEVYDEARKQGRGLWKKEIQEEEMIFCTMEAKLCPDGSSVGRVGPKCEFEACPTKRELERKKFLTKYLKNLLYCQQDKDCSIREGACGFEPMNIHFDNSKLIEMQPYIECSDYIPLENPRCENNKCVADAVGRE